MQRKLLGEKNFFSVKFPISYPEATCQVQTQSGEWTKLTRRDSGDDPQVVKKVRVMLVKVHAKVHNSERAVLFLVRS